MVNFKKGGEADAEEVFEKVLEKSQKICFRRRSFEVDRLSPDLGLFYSSIFSLRIISGFSFAF